MTTYNYRWQKARQTFLLRHPVCTMCADLGRVTAATVVHHTVAHRGDPALFWDTDNWSAVCEPCHNRFGQMQDHGKALPGCDAQGWPSDPSHPWNAARIN